MNYRKAGLVFIIAGVWFFLTGMFGTQLSRSWTEFHYTISQEVDAIMLWETGMTAEDYYWAYGRNIGDPPDRAKQEVTVKYQWKNILLTELRGPLLHHEFMYWFFVIGIALYVGDNRTIITAEDLISMNENL